MSPHDQPDCHDSLHLPRNQLGRVCSYLHEKSFSNTVPSDSGILGHSEAVLFFWLPSYICSKWERFLPNIDGRGQLPLATRVAWEPEEKTLI